MVMHQKSISFASCILQTFLYLAFAVTECLILVVMSYDRFVVICHPLKYTLIMSWRVFVIVCALPATVSMVALKFMPESPRFLLEVSLSATGVLA